MKKKFKSVTHQLDQLKQDIKSKEDELVKAHLENQQTEKEKELLKVRAFTHTLFYKGWLPLFNRVHCVPGLW